MASKVNPFNEDTKTYLKRKKEQEAMDLLNSVSSDTTPGVYHHAQNGEPISVTNRNKPLYISVGPAKTSPSPTPVAMPAQPPLEQFQKGLPEEVGAANAMEPSEALANAISSRNQFLKNITGVEPSAPYGSGRKASLGNKVEWSDKFVNTMTTMMTPEQYKSARANFDTNPEVADLRNNRELQNKILLAQMQNDKALPDLSVLKDFAKNISDGRVTMEGYQAPKNKDYGAAAEALLQNQDKNSLSLLKLAQDAIEGQKAGTFMQGGGFEAALNSMDSVVDPKSMERRNTGKPLVEVKNLKELQEKLKPYTKTYHLVDKLEGLITKALGIKSMDEFNPEVHDIPGMGAFSELNRRDPNANLIRATWQELLNQALSETGGKALTAAEMALVKRAKEGGIFGINNEAVQVEALQAIRNATRRGMIQEQGFIAGAEGGPETMAAYQKGDKFNRPLGEDIKEGAYGSKAAQPDKIGKSKKLQENERKMKEIEESIKKLSGGSSNGK